MLLHKPMLERYCDLAPPPGSKQREKYTRDVVRRFIDAFLVIN
jgi:hypothetical protein